jgi:hypothetical protein
MNRSAPPRVVLVSRATEYALLLQRHATHAQAAFFLSTRGESIERVLAHHLQLEKARAQVLEQIPARWRRAVIDREDLSRFVFEQHDIVVALGQDGLVANAAKYLEGQTVIGMNPDRASYDGILVRHEPARAALLMQAAAAERLALEERTMVEARLDDGQRLLALNEVFVGHRSHQSARYRIRYGEHEEHHSSSGLIVTTGTGATGWACSIHRQRASLIGLPRPTDRQCAFFVREAFPSVATGTSVTEGMVSPEAQLDVTSELNEGGVIFGDGIEADYLTFGWGMKAKIGVSQTCLRLAA